MTTLLGGATFLYPWCLLLAPLYCCIYLGSYFLRTTRLKNERVQIHFPSSTVLSQLPKSMRLMFRAPVLFALTTLSLGLLSIAAARPQRTSVIEQPNKGRNIALVLDVSRSMTAFDFPTSFGNVSRMDGVKNVVAEYVRSRTQDRVALVVFGKTAYLQCPLTSDSALVGDLVNDLQAGVAGDGTAIGDGMGLGLKLLQSAKEGTKAMILLTDGVNNSGSVSPTEAAKVAKDLSIPIHTIGIGVGTAPLSNNLLGGTLGLNLGPQAEFDEKTLREIARTTGGVYFNAQSLDGLKKVYDEIDSLTEEEVKAPERTSAEELFTPFLQYGLLSTTLLLLLAHSYFRRIP